MLLKLFSIASILSYASTIAVACEGDCIVEITKAFLSNYTNPVDNVLRQLVRNSQLILQLLLICEVGGGDFQSTFATCC